MVRLPRLVRIDGERSQHCKREEFIEFYLGQRLGAKSLSLKKSKLMHIKIFTSLFEQKWIQIAKMEEVRSAPAIGAGERLIQTKQGSKERRGLDQV